MHRRATCVGILSLAVTAAFGQAKEEPIQLVLPNLAGQASVRAPEAFKIVQTSARPDGGEIGVRARDNAAHLELLLFLRSYPRQSDFTSAKCRDLILDGERHDDPSVTIVNSTETKQANGLDLAEDTYNFLGQAGQRPVIVRGFLASGAECADLQVYSDDGKAGPDDPRVQQLFGNFALDPKHDADSSDLLVYGEILYRHRSFREAAPILEKALALLPPGTSRYRTQQRILADETGMAYGSSGNLAKARSVFQAAIERDPEYPMYYYNLACADAEEDNLTDARVHLQQAFDRKQNMLPGETLPNPKEDDSFSRFQVNPEFWQFLSSLH